MITLEDVKKNPEVDTYIRIGNQHLAAMGFTEHSYRHVSLVAKLAQDVLRGLHYPDREVELAGIAGYLHDIGNVISRHDHGQSGAIMAYNILDKMGMPYEEIAVIISAIGNHEEQYGHAVNPVAAALILADKSDVHRTRVRNRDVATFDIHDRVNYAAESSQLLVDPQRRTITMKLTIDLKVSSIMEYFEIFLTRMIMCRRAADFLDCNFELVINDAKLL
ncbi:MAG: uncharacterized protein PWQ96_1924 [Clostridia bacterium]|jgi:hypothetical protein|nr:metal dependent phosphohydrolase [Clostridiales bacterium]MDK2986280.1 uncharacterized protein [Clostridia bacterium]